MLNFDYFVVANEPHMAGFSQPQHFFAAARLFWVFESMHTGIGSTWIFMGLRIFLFEVLRHSDLLESYSSDQYLWLQDPLN